MELHPSLSSSVSLTKLLHNVQQGQATIRTPDLQKVCAVWIVALTRVASRIISKGIQRRVDPEDVASEVVMEFLRDLEQDPAKVRFHDRDQVWLQLRRRVRNHALNRIRDENAVKRGGGDVAGESAMGSPGEPFSPAGIGQFPDHRNDPEDYEEDSDYREERKIMLQEIAMKHPEKKVEMLAIAECLLDLMPPQEIIKKTGYSQSSVYRKIDIIRNDWQQSFFDDTPA